MDGFKKSVETAIINAWEITGQITVKRKMLNIPALCKLGFREPLLPQKQVK